MLGHLPNFIRERDLELKRCLQVKKKTQHVEIIYFVTLSVSVSIKTRCSLCGVAERERGLTCSLETIWIWVYLLSNTELLRIKILLAIREGAMVVSLNDKVMELQKN